MKNDIKLQNLLFIYEKEISKNVKNKKKLYDFEINKMQYLENIMNMLNNGSVGHNRYNIFLIYEPKCRLVMSLSVRDKVINHFVTRYTLEKKLTKYLDDRNVATRKGMGTKFKGGLASTSDINIKYHTATHLLNAALKQVLGSHVHQRGSNITAERMRFDFSHPAKMTDEEKQKTEDLVNEWITEAIPVEHLEMKKDDAIKMGAEAMFIEKYGDIVSVYKIGDVSIELCGGPHVSNTSELGHFKIKKEESSSSGIRRIKAILD